MWFVKCCQDIELLQIVHVQHANTIVNKDHEQEKHALFYEGVT
jgi:hypothetical protein